MPAHASVSDSLAAYFGELKALLDAIPLERIESIGAALYSAYRHDKQVFVVGNGGNYFRSRLEGDPVEQ